MNAIKKSGLASACALLAAGLSATPVHAQVVIQDVKSLSAVRCLPKGPDTVAADLKYSHTGIYNPGSTGAWVICDLPMDSETAYAATPGNSGFVNVYYSTGSVPGRVACSLVAGSKKWQTTPVYSQTVSPTNSPADTRTSLRLDLSYPSTPSGLTHVPITVTCVLSPQTTLAAVYFKEEVQTETF